MREVEWLDLRVTKGCSARALRIMAALILILEHEGFTLVVEKKAPESTSAIVYSEKTRFGVIERSRQVKPTVPREISNGYFPFSPVALKHRERQRGCARRHSGLLLHYRA
jgi:hypothetical protein